MSAWFRFYAEVLDDPKIQKLPCETLKTWLNLLCLTAKHDGTLPSCNDISFALRISIQDAETAISEMLKLGLLDRRGSRLAPHNWDQRQYKSDTSTDRVKRFRKRKRNVSETADETDQNRTDTEQNRTEQSIYTPDFERFWTAYPKKKGKGAAFTAWKKNGHPGIERIIQILEIASKCRDWTKDEGQFIPHPATWLNQKRWDDDYGQLKLTRPYQG